MADIVGTGTTITFSDGYAASVVNLTADDASRPVIKTSHQGSSNDTFIPGELVDHGGVTVEAIFDPDNQPGIATAAQTITIEFPSTAATGAKLSGQGFVDSWSWTDNLEELITHSYHIKWSSAPTWSDATG